MEKTGKKLESEAMLKRISKPNGRKNLNIENKVTDSLYTDAVY